MIHAFKITKQHFEDVSSGIKPFEVRKHDRDYRVNDYVALNEYDPKSDGHPEWQYTGRSILFRIDYVLKDPGYCKDGYVILGIRPCAVSGTLSWTVPITLGGERDKGG
jgi:hypothetical protein